MNFLLIHNCRFFPDLIEDSVDENVLYIPFGKEKKFALCIIMGPSFPNVAPTLKLIHMQHPFADANGILLPDIHKDLRNWNPNDSLGRIIYEVVAELQRPLFGGSSQQPMKPEYSANNNIVRSSRAILLEALEMMRYQLPNFSNHFN